MTLERDLRRALAPVDPPPGFADAVLAHLGTGLPEAAGEARRPSRLVWRWLPLGLAASLMAAVLGGAAWLEQQRGRQAALAGEQVIEALRVTSHELNDIRARAIQRMAPHGETP
jgi:hypothetical protein